MTAAVGEFKRYLFGGMIARLNRVRGLVEEEHVPVGPFECRLERGPGAGTCKPYRLVGEVPRRPCNDRVAVPHVLQDRLPAWLLSHPLTFVLEPMTAPPSSGRLARRSMGSTGKSATGLP